MNDRYGSRIDTEEMPYYYQPENFDRIVDKLVEHNVSWSPTVATWFRPLSPRADRFREERAIDPQPSDVSSFGRSCRDPRAIRKIQETSRGQAGPHQEGL